MAVTVYEGIQKIIRRYPAVDIPTALDLLDQVNRDLHGDLPLTRGVEEDLSVTSGTNEYALADDVTGVLSARWVNSATDGDWRVLEPCDPDILDQDDPGWRARDDSTPHSYYLSGSYFGLVPTPGETTTGGYPKVVQVLRKATALTQSGNFPGAIRDVSVYVEGACAKWAEQEGLETLPRHIELYEQKVKALSRFLNNRNKSLRRQMAPRSLFNLRPR